MVTLPADSSPVLRRLAIAVFALGAIVSLSALIATWRQPLLDSNSFRQTQTAITAYWLGHGGSFWSYETPALGAPWSIPMEVPIYQALVAAVRQTNLRLDSAGRLVSWLFFVLTLWPLGRIVRNLGGSRHLGLLLCGLLLLSPLYVFWSRTFMMESTALCFSVAFVSAAIAHIRAPHPSTAVAMPVFATLAALVKVTTFFTFGLIGALLVAWDLRTRSAEWRDLRLWLVRYAPIAVAGMVSIVAVGLWVHHADALKEAHPLGRKLTSANLETWNYGTWSQRLDPALWRDAVFGRTAEALGGEWVMLATLAAAIAFGRRAITWLAALVVLYVIPYTIFTNVHWVHHYYQYANALFLVAAVAIVAWHAPADWRRHVAALLVVLAAGSQVVRVARVEWALMTADRSNSNTILLRRYVRQMPPGVIVVFGYDFSSEVAYYGRHRAINVPVWVSPAQLESIRARPMLHTGGQPIAGIIECPHGARIDPNLRPIMEAFMAEQTAGRQPRTVGTCTVWR